VSHSHQQEIDRIRSEYERRAREIDPDFYSPERPANLFLYDGQVRALEHALEKAGISALGGRNLLEIGCGEGRWLRLFEQMGVEQPGIAGIDLDKGRAHHSSSRQPKADIRSGNAAELPWPDETFDIVFQSTLFTSILDPALKSSIAREMTRVLSPDGIILWYDFCYDNPRNPNVKGIGRREIRSLFPDYRCDYAAVTLAPPLARRIVPHSRPLARLLEMIRILNTHLFVTIRPIE